MMKMPTESADLCIIAFVSARIGNFKMQQIPSPVIYITSNINLNLHHQ